MKRRARASTANSIGGTITKLVAVVVILVCLAAGAVGLVLPIVPGILFLMIAAIIAARYSPTIDRLLRRNRTVAGYLDSADGFSALTLTKKAQVACLLCVKMVIDGVAFVVSVGARVLSFAVLKYRYRYR